ncbi:hypothetical protein ACFSNO_08380 [Streptomyces cirratus]
MRCPLHGAGTDPTRLVGREIKAVVASWHVYEGERSEAPLDVWLLDSEGESTRITTGSDQCLIVESETRTSRTTWASGAASRSVRTSATTLPAPPRRDRRHRRRVRRARDRPHPPGDRLRRRGPGAGRTATKGTCGSPVSQWSIPSSSLA